MFSAIIPFALLCDIDQPILPQPRLSSCVGLWVTGSSSLQAWSWDLWPYPLRAAHGAEARNSTGWCEAILFLFCSVGWNPWKPLGRQRQWHPVHLTRFYSGIPLRHSGVSGLPGGAPCFLTFIDCFWCLEVFWRAWTWVSGKLYGAKSSFHMVMFPVCRSLAVARTHRLRDLMWCWRRCCREFWFSDSCSLKQQPIVWSAKMEKSTAKHGESREDIHFFGGSNRYQQNSTEIVGIWAIGGP